MFTSWWCTTQWSWCSMCCRPSSPGHCTECSQQINHTTQAKQEVIPSNRQGIQHWTYGKTVSDGEQPDLSTNCQPVSRTFHLQKHSNWKLRNGSDPTLLCMAEVQTRDLGAAFLPPSFILDPGSQGWRF